jgi:hypothetical protein
LNRTQKNVTKFRYSLSNENLPHIYPSQNVIVTIVSSGLGQQHAARSEYITLAYKLYFESIKEKRYILDLGVDGILVGGGFFNIAARLYFIEAEFSSL